MEEGRPPDPGGGTEESGPDIPPSGGNSGPLSQETGSGEFSRNCKRPNGELRRA